MNLKVYRGDTYSIEGTIKNQDGDEVNLVGATIVFSVKRNPTDVPYVFTKTCGIVDPARGKFLIYLDVANTSQPIGDYVYDIELRFGLGSVHTVRKGTLTIMRDITV